MLNLANLKPPPAGSELDQAAFEAAARDHERFLNGLGGRRAILRFVKAGGLDGLDEPEDRPSPAQAVQEALVVPGGRLESGLVQLASRSRWF